MLASAYFIKYANATIGSHYARIITAGL